jgi:autotransporter strand-loop-strand O-heptosyltransferase
MNRAERRRAAKRGVNAFSVGFVDGALLEVTGPVDEAYHVAFVDGRTGEVVHAGEIRNDHWIRTARQYFTPWRVSVRRVSDGELVFTHEYACRDRRVYVALESKALGDTLAWMPAVEAFQAKHGCRMVCSTFTNGLFREQYPEIEFVEPGTTVHDLYAMYRLGWFYRDDGTIDPDRNPTDFRTRPLGAGACDVLGLPFVERRPRLPAVADEPPIAEPYVCIAIHATAQAKYWNHPTGWSELAAWLRGRGFRVVLLSREGVEHMGNVAPADVDVLPEGPLEDVMRLLRHATLFVGVGSGLAWLAWAVGCRTCLVSGFSLPHSEMADCIRVFPRGDVCAGCFNRHRLDPGRWDWCPDQQGTPRMFECTRAIGSEQVIAAIAPCLDAATTPR